MKEIRLEILLEEISSYKLFGNSLDKLISNIKPINEADSQTLSWVASYKNNKEELINSTLSNLIICNDKIDYSIIDIQQKCLIIVDNPKLVFLRLVKKFFIQPQSFGIHPQAIVHNEAIISPNVYIGPNTYIGKCKIGMNTVIHGNCYLYDNCVIGSNVIINAGTVIGADGFGYEKNEDGIWEKFPHIGGVTIRDNVEIGSNVTIDKGTLGDTIINENVKIDNLVHIAHNVVVGRNSFIIALSMIGGSTIIEPDVWVAPSSSIRDGIVIGEKSIIGLGSVVTKSIPRNEIWIGNPAKKLEK